MSPSSVRPPVNVATEHHGPALHVVALVLGVLAIPGSTVAWDLPAGGLWIGLPLAIGALYAGTRARRQSDRPQVRRVALAGMVLAGLCLAQMAAWTLISVVS